MEVSSDKVGSLFRWVLRMGTAKGACVLADLDIYEIGSGKYFFFRPDYKICGLYQRVSNSFLW